MSGFVMDTSGRVGADPNWDRFGGEQGLAWSDLSPFAQGYVEAMLAEAGEDLADERMAQNPRDDARLSVGFSDLAPETLARIMEDCEAMKRAPGLAEEPRGGDFFWHWRQEGKLTINGFPPLTPHLGDDGKVYLREGV